MKNAPDRKAAESARNSANSTASSPCPDLKSARNPRPGTQAFRLLAELQAGNRVDPLQGWFRLGIYRLSDTVLQLRKAGWQVITDTKEVNNRYGEVCRVASYRLPALDARSTKEAP